MKGGKNYGLGLKRNRILTYIAIEEMILFYHFKNDRILVKYIGPDSLGHNKMV